MRSIGFLAIALATAVFIGCDRNDRANDASGASSATVGTAGESHRNKASWGDKDFVHDMAIANMAEVELGKLAPERSTDAEVKKFAQLTIDDHTKSLNSLKAIATQHNVPVPTELDGRHRRLRDKIAKWHGNEFDRAYVDAMVDGHEDILDELEDRVDEARLAEWKAEMADRVAGKKVVERAEVLAILPEKSDNPVTMSLNEWAAAAYPIVRAHLDAAKVLKIAVDKRPRTTN
jgi:putative membrane protein